MIGIFMTAFIAFSTLAGIECDLKSDDGTCDAITVEYTYPNSNN